MAAAYDSDYEGSENDVQVAGDGPVIGIDLGTTYSVVGVYRNGVVEIIPNSMGKNTTPSYVAFDNDDRYVGHDAKEQAVSNPSNTIFDAKRMIGRCFRDKEVQDDLRNWPFTVIDGKPKPLIEVVINGKKERFSPEQISAMVLSQMKEMAEEHLNCPISRAVITVPAHFNDNQRNATKAAAEIAGLQVMQIINEPTAAAIAYAMDKLREKKKKRNILVYDFGGGTFDVTVLQTEGNDFVVKATNGNTHLGGADFDSLMVDHFVHKIGKRLEKSAIARLRHACEKAKIELSVHQAASIDLSHFPVRGLDFSVQITRSEFEAICFEKFQDTIQPIEDVLKALKMEVDDIDDLVLVGGSTRIPRIQEMIRFMFKGKELARDINPDEAVCHGAVVTAGLLSKDEDEEVGEIAAITVKDVCPLTLGIRVEDGTVTPLILKNTAIPCEKSQPVTTTKDNQVAVKIRIVQGERPLADDNAQLGEIVLTGIKRQAKGKAEIKVTFTIDANGILSVISRDVQTGKVKEITISNSCGIPEKKIIQMMNDAKINQHRDQEVKDRINARNELHAMIMKEKSRPKFSAQMEKILNWWERNAKADLIQLETMTDLVTRILTRDDDSCDKLHDCLHICCGLRGENRCMPCLFCKPVVMRAGDECPLCLEELSSAPCIMLKCSHVIHADCCRDMIRKRFPGPAITFKFADCPVGCGKEMEHDSLTEILKPTRELKAEVETKALHRLKYEKKDKDPEIVRPNGRFYKNPTGFAVDHYAYYECSKCQKPYFGGEARCEGQRQAAAEADQQDFDPNTLVCGACSGGAGMPVCGKHDADYSGYKCRYCCSMAVYFCFGTTHFCNKCHDNHGRLTGADKASLPQCPVGPGCVKFPGDSCPLKIQHKPTGEEYYLGCSICKNMNEM